MRAPRVSSVSVARSRPRATTPVRAVPFPWPDAADDGP